MQHLAEHRNHFGMLNSCATQIHGAHAKTTLGAMTATVLAGFSTFNFKTRLCLQAVNEFQSLVSQVQKSSSMVEKVVYSIMTASLVKDPAVQGTPDIMDLQELYDHLERFRLEVGHCTVSVLDQDQPPTVRWLAAHRHGPWVVRRHL